MYKNIIFLTLVKYIKHSSFLTNMQRQLLAQVLLEQREYFEKKQSFIPRTIPHNLLTTKKIVVLSGIRRSGKSVLLQQIKKTLNKEYYYVNFEDERLLEFTHKDFNLLLEVFIELFGEQKIFFFDEIQNIKGWEKFVRRLYEDGNKIFVTGSNATLLSSELATTLTGRQLTHKVYPFSFQEILTHNNISYTSTLTTKQKSVIKKLFDQYVQLGGFPEVVISKDKEELRQLYQDILIKDLLVRFKIREEKTFREFVLFLLSNIGKKISFNKIKNLLELKSTTSVKNYVQFLEETYLLFTITKYDFSIKKQIINDKKIYAIDTGLINSVSFAFSKNSGRILENIVYLQLLRNNKETYYFSQKNECDFLIKEGLKITQAIQVTHTLQDKLTRKREIQGLLDAMTTYKLQEGLILTDDEEETIQEEGITIQVRPVWKWLLD